MTLVHMHKYMQHMPTCLDIHKHWHHEDALLLCWLTEFKGKPNTLSLTKKKRDGERENTEISLQGGIQERKVDKKESMI